jgi:tetratricopeptide (TPR) repeat protein
LHVIRIRLPATALAAVLLILVLALAWGVYHPGLGGGFLFDDFANLPELGHYGRIDNWTSFWLYITSGGADPTGRPLALLSFLLDANEWPADPYSFKRTNVLLHLLNGALLTLLLLSLRPRNDRAEKPAVFAAVLAAALWLLHPFLVSTTLYIVQRETLLSTTFVLLGLVGYVRGRMRAAVGEKTGVWIAAVSMGVATVCATLSKANGALLPLLALVLETVYLAPQWPITHPQTQRGFNVVRAVLLILPGVMLAVFLAWTAYRGFVYGMPAHRTWTLGQRLLSESRVLTDYLGRLWIPRAFNSGLYTEDFSVSTGLLSPPSTLACIVFLFGLLFAAWRIRRRHAALATSIVFFFAGHLLESTVVPLELYFEHRNYLPSVLMFWPLSLWICSRDIPKNAKIGLRRLRIVLAFGLPLLLAMLTFLGAELWGNVRDQAVVWAWLNPGSARAQANTAQLDLKHGNTLAAMNRLDEALRSNPAEVQLALNAIAAKCQAGLLTDADIERAASALRNAVDSGRLGYDWFERGLPVAEKGGCHGLTLKVLETLLAAAAQNEHTKHIPGRVQDRLHLQARIALLQHDDQHALALFDAAFDADPRPGAALQQAAILASAGAPELAQRHIEHMLQVWQPPRGPGWTMQSLHEWLMWKTGYWDHEIAQLRDTLERDELAKRNHE